MSEQSERRINVSAVVPEAYKALEQLSGTISTAAAEAGLDARLVELVKMRASQLNGCAYCLEVHVALAVKAGETVQRIGVLPAWRESAVFSPQERAALEIAEAVTLIGDGQFSDEVYQTAHAAFDERQYGIVVWIAAAINVYNRTVLASRFPIARKSGA